jgi:hypothetical protein
LRQERAPCPSTKYGCAGFLQKAVSPLGSALAGPRHPKHSRCRLKLDGTSPRGGNAAHPPNLQVSASSEHCSRRPPRDRPSLPTQANCRARSSARSFSTSSCSKIAQSIASPETIVENAVLQCQVWGKLRNRDGEVPKGTCICQVRASVSARATVRAAFRTCENRSGR